MTKRRKIYTVFLTLNQSLRFCDPFRLLRIFPMFPNSACIAVSILILLEALPLAHAASEICPLLGADVPAPTNLAICSHFNEAKERVTLQIQQALKGSLLDSSTTVFSANVWSTTEDSLFQYNFAGPEALNKTAGAEEVDLDTVYRIGSVSKLYTVLTLLVQDGDLHFNFPVTEYLPELKGLANNGSVPYYGIEWEDVTIGSLASQTSGLERECMQCGVCF